MKRIAELLEGMEYEWLRGENPEMPISGLTHDNREIQAGDLFVCIAGARFDTHTILDKIAAAGAAAAVVSQEVSAEELPEQFGIIRVADSRLAAAQLAAAWYSHPARQLQQIIGVTGSKGKTTVTHMLADILRAEGYEVGTIGSNGAIIRGEIHELSNTTPDAMEVQMYLAKMVNCGCDIAVVECSSQGLMQHRVSGFTFDYGIFTNISEGDHISPTEHKDFEEYLRCKAMLLQNSRRAAVFSQDAHTPELLECLGERAENEIILYGLEQNDDGKRLLYNKYCAGGIEKIYENGRPGQRFHLTGGGYDMTVALNLPGDFNVTNALAAISVAAELHVSPEAISRTMANLSIKGRLDIVYSDERFAVCVDFAHNGYSTRNLLEALREYRPKRLVCIFGADGNRAKSRRYEMGEASGRLADLSIVTSGHNRWERFEEILADIMTGLGPTGGSYLVIPDRKEAIRYAIEHVQQGDMITVIGLGHETYQEENGVKYPYSDTEYVLSVIAEREGVRQS